MTVKAVNTRLTLIQPRCIFYISHVTMLSQVPVTVLTANNCSTLWFITFNLIRLERATHFASCKIFCSVAGPISFGSGIRILGSDNPGLQIRMPEATYLRIRVLPERFVAIDKNMCQTGTYFI
jgi:hypothetical protein